MKLLARFVDKPRTVALRRWLFQVHLWVGVIVGIYAIAIGVSGSALMFREEFVEWETSQWLHVAPQPGRAYASPDEWAAVIRKAAGAPAPINFIFPEKPGDVVIGTIFRPSGPQRYHVDPYTAELLGVYTRTGGVMRFLEILHHNLFLGRSGRLVNGIGALSLLLLAMTGIVIWWPGRKLWRRRLTIDPKAGWKRVNFDLHHAVGFWGLLGFTVLCVTGAWFSWPQVFRGAVARFYPVTPAQGPPKFARPEGAVVLPLSRLLAAADAAVPEKRSMRALVPAAGGQPARINKAGEGDGKPFFRTATTVVLNPYTAEVLRIESPEKKTSGDRILSWIGPLHFGNFGGPAVQWLYFVLGLTMPVLFVSGFLMWWLRVVRKRWLRGSRESVSPFVRQVEIREASITFEGRE